MSKTNSSKLETSFIKPLKKTLSKCFQNLSKQGYSRPLLIEILKIVFSNPKTFLER